MRKKHIIFSDLPLVVGKRYQTKFATGEWVTIFDIQHTKESVLKHQKDNKSPLAIQSIYVIYDKCPNLGPCPLDENRIVHDKKFEREIEICGKCKKPLDEHIEIEE